MRPVRLAFFFMTISILAACGDSSRGNPDENSRNLAAQKFQDAPRTRSMIDEYRRGLPRVRKPRPLNTSPGADTTTYLYNPNRTLRLRMGKPAKNRLREMRVETARGRLLRILVPARSARWLNNDRLRVCGDSPTKAESQCEILAAGAFVRRAAPAGESP